MTEKEEAFRLIRNATRVAIATHIAPDPDAIGSLLGLGHALTQCGKTVELLCDDEVPKKLLFLPGAGRIRQQFTGDRPDIFVCLDASDDERLGEAGKRLLASGVRSINIDHHVTNLNFGDVNVVAPFAAATAEVLVDFIVEMGLSISKDTASCLCAGIVGDTRGFSTSNVTSHTLHTASLLVESGADLPQISEAILNRKSFTELQYLGLALQNMHLEGQIAWTAISVSDRERDNLPEIKDVGISNTLLSIDEAVISACFVEKPDSGVEISLRAMKDFDVGRVALTLGGGGHKAAAGCTVDGPLETAVEKVLNLLRAEIAQTRGS